MGQYLGIDFHRRRSVIVRMNDAGEVLCWERIDNDPVEIARVVCDGEAGVPVAIEATYGWYWIVDLLLDLGLEVHLAHPSAIVTYERRRVKNDLADATVLADLLRMGRLPEAWVAPPELRQFRELVRLRHKLVEARASLKTQTHSVLAKQGILPEVGLWTGKGSVFLDDLELDDGFDQRVEITRRLIDTHTTEINQLEPLIVERAGTYPAFGAVKTIDGIGDVLGAVFVAEIGDISRFDSPDRLTSWVGLTPRHRESDTTVSRGAITKQGSRLVRWAAIEAVTASHCHPHLKAFRKRLEARRPANVAKVAAARKLIGCVYWAMRDGEVRSLTKHAEAA